MAAIGSGVQKVVVGARLAGNIWFLKLREYALSGPAASEYQSSTHRNIPSLSIASPSVVRQICTTSPPISPADIARQRTVLSPADPRLFHMPSTSLSTAYPLTRTTPDDRPG